MTRLENCLLCGLKFEEDEEKEHVHDVVTGKLIRPTNKPHTLDETDGKGGTGA